MAVKSKLNQAKRTPEMQDFWRIHHRKTIILSITVQILITCAIMLAFLVLQIDLNLLQIVAFSVATLAISLIINLAVLSSALQPLHDLSIAIITAAGQYVDGKLPNPTDEEYQTTGFSQILLSIYNEQKFHTDQTNSTRSSKLDDELMRGLNMTSTGIVILDKNDEILFSNKAAPIVQDTNGHSRLQLLFDDGVSIEKWLENCRKTSVHAEKTWRRIPNKLVGDEGRRIFDVTASFEQGSVANAVIVMYDESAIYQPEDDDLDFISFAAHELRGPITVIRGYLDVLSTELSGKLAPDQQELLQRLIVSGNRLSGYINNILNTSRYDRRHLKLDLTETSLEKVYDSVRDDMDLRAKAQRRLLAVDIPKDLPTIAADASSLSEVLSNLIDNAIKYSHEGGSVHVAATAKNNFVEVSVSDTGIGIPTSVMSNLFHKFYRSHRSRETVAGTGIGLYLSKAIIDSHGGTIGVSSQEGAGSTFTFTVPTYASVAEKLQDSNSSNVEMIRTSGGWINNHSKYTE